MCFVLTLVTLLKILIKSSLMPLSCFWATWKSFSPICEGRCISMFLSVATCICPLMTSRLRTHCLAVMSSSESGLLSYQTVTIWSEINRKVWFLVANSNSSISGSLSLSHSLTSHFNIRMCHMCQYDSEFSLLVPVHSQREVFPTLLLYDSVCRLAGVCCFLCLQLPLPNRWDLQTTICT